MAALRIWTYVHLLTQVHATTVDGYETNMGINALGPHYLTQQLIPALVASYRTTPENPPRVCFTSSLLHRGASAKGFDPEDPSGLKAPRPFGLAPQMRAYGSSKFANILSVKKLDRQYGPDGIVFTAVHPGGLRTGILKDSPGLFGAALRLTSQLFFYPQEMGALTPLYAGTAPETAKKGGRYFASWAREVEPMTLTEHEGIQDACTSHLLTQSTHGSASKCPSTRKLPHEEGHRASFRACARTCMTSETLLDW